MVSLPRWAAPITMRSIPRGDGAVEKVMQGGDDGLGPLEREALLADEGPLQEALELLGLDEVLEDDPPPPGVEGRVAYAGSSIRRDEPFAHVLVLDVEELDADIAAIDAAEASRGCPGGASVARRPPPAK